MRRFLSQLSLFKESAFQNSEVPAPHFLEIGERELASFAVALGARKIPGWSRPEEAIARSPVRVKQADVDSLRRYILAGRDPLGEIFSHIRRAEKRRKTGATFTPWPIVD